MLPTRYPELERFAKLSGSVGYCFLGSVHRAPGAVDRFVTETSARRGVVQGRLDDEGLLDVVAGAERQSLVVLDPASSRMTLAQAEERLSNLRVVVQDVRQRGVSVLFLSERPLACHPILAGSSVLADAETVRVRHLAHEESIKVLSEIGTPGGDAERIAGFADGSRALLAAYVEVERSEVSGNQKRQQATAAEASIANQTFDEIGADLATLLESWVFEGKLTELEPSDFPSESIMSALLQSGLLRRRNGNTVTLLPFKDRECWLSALATWISCVTAPPQSWSRVASELFSLERLLRQDVAHFLENRDGPDWRNSQSLHRFAPSILELARRDGIPVSLELGDLRGPLDWLQLSELLALAAELAGNNGSWLGMRADEWDSAGRKVLPIRHRIAHMRLVRAGDLELVRNTRRLIDLRRMSGAQS